MQITIDESATPTHNFELYVDDVFLKDVQFEVTGLTASTYTIIITYSDQELEDHAIFDELYASLWKFYDHIWSQVPVENIVFDPANNTITATLDHLCHIAMVFETPELTLEICTANTQVLAGEEIQYKVHLENNGDGRAPNVDLAITFPENVMFIASDIPYSGSAGQTYHWLWSELLPGDSITFYVTVRASILFQEGDQVITLADCAFNGPTSALEHETAQATTWIVSAEPSGELRTIGFWKHQVLAILDGKGRNQTSQADMILYCDMIQASTTLFDLDGDFTLEEAKGVLVLKKGASMRDRALQQLLAVYFNLAARAVNSDTEINMTLSDNIGLYQYDYLTTIGQAVQFTVNVLENENSDLYEDVKDVSAMRSIKGSFS